jgi:hypothetical protein
MDFKKLNLLKQQHDSKRLLTVAVVALIKKCETDLTVLNDFVTAAAATLNSSAEKREEIIQRFSLAKDDSDELKTCTKALVIAEMELSSAKDNVTHGEDQLNSLNVKRDALLLDFKTIHKSLEKEQQDFTNANLMLVHSENIDGLDLYRADCTNEYLSVLCSSDEKEAYLKTINACVAVDKSQPVWQLRQVVEKPLDDTRVKLTGVMLEANLDNCWLYDVQDILRCTPLCSFEKPDQILLVDTVLPNLYLTARRVLPLITGTNTLIYVRID